MPPQEKSPIDIPPDLETKIQSFTEKGIPDNVMENTRNFYRDAFRELLSIGRPEEEAVSLISGAIERRLKELNG